MPKAKLTYLSPRVATSDSRKVKPPPRPPAFAAPLYQTPEWKHLRRTVIAERGYQCERCGRTDGLMDLHHIVEIRDGGKPLDPRNVQLICREEHLLLTKNARAERFGLPAPYDVRKPAAPHARGAPRQPDGADETQATGGPTRYIIV